MVGTQVRIEEIRMEGRYRRDMGDIEGLARSMMEVGLLHPVVVTPDLRLIAGERRILAARMLGWDTIPAHVVDLADVLRGEWTENAERKDFTASEAVAIGRALEPGEREAARERQEAQEYGRGVTCEKVTQVREQTALDKVAARVGMSRPTYAKAAAVVDAAEREPERYGEVLEKMDATGNVSAAYRDLKRKEEQLERKIEDPPARDVKIIQGDMMDALPVLGEFDLIVADPPYNVTDYAWDEIGADYLGRSEMWLRACKAALSPQYHLFWFCSPRYAADIEMIFRRVGLPIESRIIWHRRNMAMGSDAKARFIDSWEMIFHAGNRALNFSQIWDDSRFDVQIFAVPQTNFDDRKIHPTQKPQALMQRLVEFGSYPGERVLDPFAGAGTTAVAPTNRRYVLIESEPDYIRIIHERLGL